jgi:hypothetical protein
LLIKDRLNHPDKLILIITTTTTATTTTTTITFPSILKLQPTKQNLHNNFKMGLFGGDDLSTHVESTYDPTTNTNTEENGKFLISIHLFVR